LAGKGGYQRPANPAPVSGPGALSRRTDGNAASKQPIRTPTGGSYGSAKELADLQRTEPLAQTPEGQTGQASPAGLLQGLSLPQTVGFDQGTQEPDTPVTAGAALGAGPGTEALGITDQEDSDLRALTQYLPVFEAMANTRGSSKAARNLVRQLKAYAGGA
jgi:hypothetical protein